MTQWPKVDVSIPDLNMVISTLTNFASYVEDGDALCERAIKVAKKSRSRGDKILAYRMNGAYYFFIGTIQKGLILLACIAFIVVSARLIGKE